MNGRSLALDAWLPGLGRLLGRGSVRALLIAVALACLAAWLVATGDRDRSGFHEPAPAAETVTTTPAQARADGRRALALVDLPPLELGYEIRFEPRAAGTAVRGETDRRERTITIFVSSADATHLVAHDIAHEVGHAVDDRLLTDARRREYLRRRGAADARWWPGGTFSDYASGAGDFAEVFALCHAASPEYRSRLAPRPAEACSLLPDLPGVHAGERMGVR